MEHTLALISNRREEVLKIIAEAEKALAAAQAELHELEVAGKTLARLTGAEWVASGKENAEAATDTIVVQPSGDPPVTEMILMVMQSAEQTGDIFGGLAPKDVRVLIRRRFGKDVRGEYVSTQMWRLAQKGTLEKIGDGLYRLTKKS